MVNTVVNGYITVIVLILFLAFYSPLAGIVALAGVLLSALFLHLLEKQSRKNAPVHQKAQDDMVESSIEYLRGMQIVKAFKQEGVSIARILRVELCGVICRVIHRLLGIDRLLVYGLLRVNRRLGLLLGCLRLCCRLLRSPGGLRLCRYGRTASCAEGAVFGDLCSAFFTKSHKFLPSFRADTRSRHAAVSPRINFYCFYYNKFDFGCKCLSGNFKKTVSRSSYVLSAAAKAREAYAFFQNQARLLNCWGERPVWVLKAL